MKKFCILEQGCSINDPLTSKKKSLFTTSFSDFYRLNWSRKDDPLADIHATDIVWSEGRSLLYDSVPKDYEYYIFTDDDIDFSSVGGNIAEDIKALLDEYNPITGTFLDIDRFTNPNRRNFISHQPLDECLSHKAFPISGYDQQVQIYSHDYANVMFPTIYHGSGGSMWYSQWICYQQHPAKQLCFTGVTAFNSRKEEHKNDLNSHHKKVSELVALFDADLKTGRYDIRGPQIIDNNLLAFHLDADKTKTPYSLESFSKLYDISNHFFLTRTPTVLDKPSYLKSVNAKLNLQT